MQPVVESIIAGQMPGNGVIGSWGAHACCRDGERGKAKPVETSLANGADLEAKTEFAVNRFLQELGR